MAIYTVQREPIIIGPPEGIKKKCPPKCADCHSNCHPSTDKHCKPDVKLTADCKSKGCADNPNCRWSGVVLWRKKKAGTDNPPKGGKEGGASKDSNFTDSRDWTVLIVGGVILVVVLVALRSF